MERELKNGKKYRFEQLFSDFIKAYCFYDGKWNPLAVDFRSWEEVELWCDKLEYNFEHPQVWKPAEVPQDYYGREGVYFGD